MFTQEMLEARGWTPTLIKKYLGKPDATEELPISRENDRGPRPLRRYWVAERAMKAEESLEWMKARMKVIRYELVRRERELEMERARKGEPLP